MKYIVGLILTLFLLVGTSEAQPPWLPTDFRDFDTNFVDEPLEDTAHLGGINIRNGSLMVDNSVLAQANNVNDLDPETGNHLVDSDIRMEATSTITVKNGGVLDFAPVMLPGYSFSYESPVQNGAKFVDSGGVDSGLGYNIDGNGRDLNMLTDNANQFGAVMNIEDGGYVGVQQLRIQRHAQVNLSGSGTLFLSGDGLATDAGAGPSGYWHFQTTPHQEPGDTGLVNILPDWTGEFVLARYLKIDPADTTSGNRISRQYQGFAYDGVEIASEEEWHQRFVATMSTMPALGTNNPGQPNINLTTIKLRPAALPGDYNEDGMVNLADYTVWRDSLGANISLPGEDDGASTPGVVDVEDYEFWKANFGNTGGAGAVAASTIPEPATVTLALVGSVAVAGIGRRRLR